MKNRSILLPLMTATVSTFAPLSAVFGQGSLTPPSAPAPTMKSLSQIEPRTPISSLPFTVTNPGAYYLTTNLAGVGGITVNTNDVAIDLNGFALTAGGGDGISASTSFTNLSVRNGTVCNCGVSGLNVNSRYSRIEGVLAFNNGGTGIGVAADESTVIGCTSVSNGFQGLAVGAKAMVRDCISAFNQQDGIIFGSDSVILTSIVQSNLVGGISSISSSGVVIEDCTASGNGGFGIATGARSVVRDCSASGNLGDGIRVLSDCLVHGNLAIGNTNNSAAGIHVAGLSAAGARIEGNMVNGNGRGILVDGGFNLIIGNSAHGNGTNYVFAANNTYGPTNSVSGELTSTNSNSFSNLSF